MGEVGVLGDFMSVGSKTSIRAEGAPGAPAEAPKLAQSADDSLPTLPPSEVSLDEVYRCLSGGLRGHSTG
jgi:hypothetical protein